MKARSGGFALVVALALAAPLSAGIVLAVARASESPLESAAEAAPLVGSVERAERYHEALVPLTVTYADALTPATNASGVLTALRIGPGDEVTTGDVVATVNNQELVAHSAETPLFRDIYRGLKGADVETAQRLLKQLGLYTGTLDGNAGAATASAIKAFNSKYGWGDDSTVLRIASVVWVGDASVTVVKPSLAVGSQVAPGAELFTTTASLASVVVSETPGLPVGAEVTLTVGDVSVPFEAGSGAVTAPDHVAAVAAAMGSASEGMGTMALKTAEAVGSVPSSAVFSDETGGTCIFPDVIGAAVAVTPLGGSLGTVDLDESLVGQAVLINPREVREDLTCG